MTDDIKAIRDARLSVRIMNLTRQQLPHNLRVDDISMAYRMGYRDARRDAANLAAEADERIARLLDALEAATRDAERYRWLRQVAEGEATLGDDGMQINLYGLHGDAAAAFLRNAPHLTAAIDAALKRGA